MTMATKNTSFGSIKAQISTFQKSKQLSKAAIWRLNNPDGIIIVHDRRAANQ